MEINKQDIVKYGIAALIGAVISFFIFKGEVKEVEVPIRVEVPVPSIEKQFDTVYYPKPVYVKGKTQIDSSYYKKYSVLKDSIAKDSLFKEAITLNTYRERVEDDTIKIDLGLKVRGELLNYNVDYFIKERTVTLDTVLKIPVPKKPILMVGGEAVIPTDVINYKLSIKPGVLFINRNNNKGIKVSYDPINKVFEGGLYFKL